MKNRNTGGPRFVAAEVAESVKVIFGSSEFLKVRLEVVLVEDLVDVGEIVVRENKGHVGQVYFLGGVNE